MTVPKEIEPYFLLLGWFVHSWSQVERNIDVYVAVVYHRCDGRTLIAEEYPRTALSRKLRYLRQAAETLPRLRPHAGELTAIVDAADEASTVRHNIFHGNLQSLSPDMIVLNKIDLDPKDGSLVSREINIAADVFVAHADNVTSLASAAFMLSAKLLDDFGEDLIRETVG